VNEAVPVPLFVTLLAIVGLEFVLLQQTPFAVIVAPPASEIVPPLNAVVAVIEVIAVVLDTVGTTGPVVVNVLVFPYAVPMLFVA
jgi:uncharacterized membrane protein